MTDRKKVTLPTLFNKIEKGEPISWLTCYDYPTAHFQEQAEIDIISEYLPQALSEEEIESIINSAISQTGASTMKDMGKVMAIVKPQITGRADMGAVSGKIKSLLS